MKTYWFCIFEIVTKDDCKTLHKSKTLCESETKFFSLQAAHAAIGKGLEKAKMLEFGISNSTTLITNQGEISKEEYDTIKKAIENS